MTARGGRSMPDGSHPVWPVVAVLAAGLLALLLAGTAAAVAPPGYHDHVNSTDTQAPWLENGTAVNGTVLEVFVRDNHDVEEGSITADDFLVPDVAEFEVTATERGSNAVVRFELASPVDQDELYVALKENATISDTLGNSRPGKSQRSSVTVTGTDGVSPTIDEFAVSNATGSPARITVRASEPLGSITVRVRGPVGTTLTRSAFVHNRSAGRYVATYRPTVDGNYEIQLVEVADPSGNVREPLLLREQIVAELTPPDAVAVLDRSASTNTTLTFDAGRSVDSSGIERFRWSFGDGATASGRRVSHTFLPGSYTVNLTAVDRYGNVGTDSLSVNVTASGPVVDSNATGPTVTVSRPADPPASEAIVSVRGGRTGVPVRAGRTAGDGTLASTDDIALEGISIVLERNASFGLAVSVMDSLAAPSPETSGTAVGEFAIVHDLPETAIRNVTLAVSVPNGRLEALGVAPSSLSVVRRNGGEWSRLPTSVTERAGDDAVDVRALSPGLSRFVLLAEDGSPTGADGSTGTPTPTPTPTPTGTPTPQSADGTTASPVVTDAALNRTRVPPDAAVRVNATVHNAGSEHAAYVAALSVNGTVTATRTVGVGPGDSRRVQFVYATNRTGTYPIAVNGTSAGDLTVESGGVLASVLGFLPLWAIRPLVLFVLVPALLVYGVLKGLAIYLGY